jgi:hypothetical protein
LFPRKPMCETKLKIIKVHMNPLQHFSIGQRKHLQEITCGGVKIQIH